MPRIEARAPAKINLSLHVTGRREDGYHLLDSLVVFSEVADDLSLTEGADMAMAVSGPFADGVPVDGSNLVWRALKAAGWAGRVLLEKNLPHGAGLGGGSADAAAALRALGSKGEIGAEVALALGADVPVCMRTTPQHMAGIGEVLTPVSAIPSLPLVLIHPGVHVSTPEIFNSLTSRENPPMSALGNWEDCETFLDWLADQRNDLEATAIAHAPEIGAALEALSGAKLARMSGSGAACFGVFETLAEAQDAARGIAELHPGWWVVATRTTGSA